ncbi:LysR family transcriptional regulator [Paenibacillus aestuarii]|uniref:LysR family transcriptional regulator n=1 Tax=Paenibacillus aestuarii TaxID=516965 RepID=A0ABW0KHT9_9BACL|nr:LysR family transcriptional regulator [Paenibacillus aestuarii]
MELSQLEAFLAVSHCRNFTRAAEYLHISQSAVTARIKALEQSLGKPLFMRDNRNVSLTQAGLHFQPYAERMLLLYEESKLTVSESLENYIVMSGPGSVWHYRYLPNILALRDNHPNAAIKFLSYIDSSYMIRDLLLDGIVHVAIRYEPMERPNITKIALYEDEIILVSASQTEQPVTKSDFHSRAYCHVDWGHPFSDWFSNWVGGGFIPALELDHSSIQLTLLLQGAGFGFLPRSIAQPYLDELRLFALRCEHSFPVTQAYALYLTEHRDHPSVKLGLQILGLG